MLFNQAFALSSVTLAATAFSGLVLAQSVPFWLALPTAIILVGSLFHAGGVLFVRRAMAQITDSPTLWNALLIGAFAILLIDLLVVSRDLLPAGIHFLVVLLGIKLLTLQQRRDYRHLYVISLMAILASAALTTEAWYVPIFMLYLLTAVWTLLLYHLTQETSEIPPAVTLSGMGACRATFPSRITHRVFWLTNGIVVLTVALTLAIFFLIPRIGVGVLQKTSGETVRTTGFSDRVDLGTIGSVKQDPQIVMRVELPDQSAVEKDRFYLRGLAYDQYNGQSWSHSGTRQRSLNLVADGTFLVRPAGSYPLDRPSHAIDRIYQADCFYRQTGVVLAGLVPETKVQYTLFDDPAKIEKMARIYTAVDALSEKFGKYTVHHASSLPTKIQSQNEGERGDVPQRTKMQPFQGREQKTTAGIAVTAYKSVTIK